MVITFFSFLLNMFCNFFLTTKQVDLVLFTGRAAFDRFAEGVSSGRRLDGHH